MCEERSVACVRRTQSQFNGALPSQMISHEGAAEISALKDLLIQRRVESRNETPETGGIPFRPTVERKRAAATGER